MSLPSFPSMTPTISLSIAQTIPLLLGSIALEELALAHIINAEAEGLQFVLGTLTPTHTIFTPATVSLSNFLAVNADVRRTLRDVIKKEMLLEFKFDNVQDLIATTGTEDVYGNFWQTNNLIVPTGAPFPFNASSPTSGGVTLVGGNTVFVPLAGDYRVSYIVRVWRAGTNQIQPGVGIFLNGSIVPNAQTSNQVFYPDPDDAQDVRELSGEAIIHIPASSTLQLRNISGSFDTTITTFDGLGFQSVELTLIKVS